MAWFPKTRDEIHDVLARFHEAHGNPARRMYMPRAMWINMMKWTRPDGTPIFSSRSTDSVELFKCPIDFEVVYPAKEFRLE